MCNAFSFTATSNEQDVAILYLLPYAIKAVTLKNPEKATTSRGKRRKIESLEEREKKIKAQEMFIVIVEVSPPLTPFMDGFVNVIW